MTTMRILDRYVIRELIPATLLGFSLFTFLLLTQYLLKLSRMLIQQGVGFREVGWILVYSLPHVVVLTIPMAVLLGGLIAFGRMSADSEVVALRTGGISLWRLAVPVLVFGIVAWMANTWMFVEVLPWGNTHLRQLQWEIVSTRTISGEIKPRVFNEDYPGLVLYIEDKSAAGDEWYDVFIARTDEQPPELLMARRASPQFDPDSRTTWLHLEEGISYSGSAEPREVTVARFDSQTIMLYSDRRRGRVGEVDKDERSMDLGELQEAIEERKSAGEPYSYLVVEIHKKLSFPVACVILGLLAIPLGVSTTRRTKTTGFVIAIVVILVYYLFVENGEKFAEEGVLPPWLGIWSANLVFGPAALLLLWKKAREIDLGIADRLGQARDWLLGRVLRLLSQLRGDDERSSPDDGDRRDALRRTWRFPRTLDRYVMSQFAKIYLLAHGAFAAIWIVVDFFEISDDIFAVGGGMGMALRYYKFYIAEILHLTFPVAVLIGVLTVFGIMSRQNEVVAALSGGISIYRLALPVLFPALLLTVADFYLQDYILPYTTRRVEEIKHSMELGNPQTYGAGSGRWAFGRGDRLFHFSDYDPERRRFQGVYVFHLADDRARLNRLVYADQAVWQEDEERWSARNGWRRYYVTEALPDGGSVHRAGPTEEFRLAPLLAVDERPEYFGRSHDAPEELPLLELREYIDDLEQRGFDASRYRMAFHSKLAMPAVILVMAVVGIAFAFRMGRQGTLVGVGIAIGLAATFWVAFVAFKAIGEAEFLPPILAAWAPHTLFLATAAYLMLDQPT